MTLNQIYENIQMDFPSYAIATIAIDVRNVYSDFCYKTGLPRKKYNLALTSATHYSLASTVNRVYDVEVLNSNGELIDDISYAIDNKIIYFYDTYGGKLNSMPSTVATVSIYYHATPAASLVATDILDIPEQFHPALIEGVSAKYYRREKDYQNASLSQQAYREYIADGKKWCNTNGLVKHNLMPDIIFNTDWGAGVSSVSGGSGGGGTVIVGGLNIPYGTTAERPILTTADVGYIYFDTTINSPIWWNGTEWV